MGPCDQSSRWCGAVLHPSGRAGSACQPARWEHLLAGGCKTNLGTVDWAPGNSVCAPRPSSAARSGTNRPALYRHTLDSASPRAYRHNEAPSDLYPFLATAGLSASLLAQDAHRRASGLASHRLPLPPSHLALLWLPSTPRPLPRPLCRGPAEGPLCPLCCPLCWVPSPLPPASSQRTYARAWFSAACPLQPPSSPGSAS